MVKVGRVAVTSADPPRWRASTSGPWVRQAERFELRMATVRPSLVSIANIFQRVSLNSWELRRCSCALAETTKGLFTVRRDDPVVEGLVALR